MATYTTYTKERLAEALLKLIEQRPLSEISISEVAETAQVNRTSFYRNFDSKEDILHFAFTKRLEAWKETHEVMRAFDGDPYLQTRDFFEFFLHERKLVLKLFHAGALDSILLRYLGEEIGPLEGDHPDDAFYRSYHLHGMFGIYLEWIRQGMTQSPERMAALVVYQMNQPHDGLIRK